MWVVFILFISGWFILQELKAVIILNSDPIGFSRFDWSRQMLVIFREAHFYTNDAQAAKTLLRTICCRKFTHFRPYLYLYRKKEGAEEFETGMFSGMDFCV